MGLDIGTNVTVLAVFSQGLLSFFSPCVLPLLPIYVSYLAGGAAQVGEDGVIRYPRGRVFWHTVFFVLGVSFAFFLLGLGATALGGFLNDNRVWFARISGAIMVLFGLYQFGFLGRSAALEQEHRLPFGLKGRSMTPFLALLLGFTFSFAWTPCIGPILGGVLLMVSSTGSMASGLALIGVYTLGFVLPFLAVGLFTQSLLGFFKRHQKGMRYTVKITALLLIVLGVLTFTGVTGNFATALTETSDVGTEVEQTEEQQGTELLPATDFTLIDQYGNTHTLSEYKGKTVFLNFWATWCKYCKAEMPDIQALYEQYGENQGDLIVLGVASPVSEGHSGDVETSWQLVNDYLTENNYTFPVVMDTTGDIIKAYSITSYPVTYFIDSDGNVYGWLVGELDAETMQSAVKQTMDSVK